MTYVDPRWVAAEENIEARVKERVGPECVVNFAAYEQDADGVPVDNLDEVPIEGKFKIVQECKYRDGKIGVFESAVLDSPTWLDLCVVANEMYLAIYNDDHRFIDFVRLRETDRDVRIATFHLGS